MGLHGHFLSSMLWFCMALPFVDMCMCTFTVSVSLYVLQFCCVLRFIHLPYGFYSLSSSSSPGFPELWREGFGGDIPCRPLCSKDSLNNICLKFSVSVSMLFKRKPNDNWVRHLKVSITEHRWQSFYYYISFVCRPVMFGFTISLHSLGSASWPSKLCKVWVPSCWIMLKSTQILIDNTQNSVPPLH